MRIVAGTWRGKALTAPAGQTTRPTADRVRQALFDMLVHAPWGGRGVIEGAIVMDAFAGTGALGLEALSRGAARAVFVDNNSAALKALKANIAACKAEDRAEVLAGDLFGLALKGSGRKALYDGPGATLVFLDPPYRQDLVPRALERLRAVGRLAPDALIVAETEMTDEWVPDVPVLAERRHGAARLTVFRVGG